MGWLDRLRTSAREDERRALRERVQVTASSPVRSCQLRSRVRLSGTIRSTRVDMRGGSPTFEAEVFDGDATVRALFLGRRRIRGLDVGRDLVLEGRLTSVDGEPTVFNPSYQLLP